MLQLAIPDDAPPVLAPSAAYRGLEARAKVSYHASLPGSVQELIRRIEGAEAVINVRSSSKFTAEVFARSSSLRVLSIWGTGTDNVDLAAAARQGVTVTNTPGVAAASIAEHCLALLLAVARRLHAADAAVRRGEWPRGEGMQLHGKTLGVIGLGAIGSRFARLGQAIGMRVIAWTMRPDPPPAFDMVPLERLYRESDVVSLHLRLSDRTIRAIGAAEFALMKPSAIFLNTARGPIVDEAALIAALSEGRIRGAGLDVFEKEPLPPGHPLTELANVVLTPHSAGVTPETVAAGLQMAVDNVFRFLDGHPEHVVK